MKANWFFPLAVLLVSGFVVSGLAESTSAKDPVKMEKRSQVYRCEVCGTIVEILEPGPATLVHCGEPMVLLEEKTEGPGAEKHVPVVEKIDGGYRVTVHHVSTEAHYIPWIELITEKGVLRKYIKAGEEPIAEFETDAKEVTARAYCNLHGLWKDK